MNRPVLGSRAGIFLPVEVVAVVGLLGAILPAVDVVGFVETNRPVLGSRAGIFLPVEVVVVVGLVGLVGAILPDAGFDVLDEINLPVLGSRTDPFLFWAKVVPDRQNTANIANRNLNLIADFALSVSYTLANFD